MSTQKPEQRQSDSSNSVESPYQKRPSLAEDHESEDENDSSLDVLHHMEEHQPHRRKTSPQRHYTRHISFEGFFPDDDNKYGIHDGSRWHRLKKRAILSGFCAALIFVVALSWRSSAPSPGLRQNGNPQNVASDEPVQPCKRDDPIMALKDSSTIENITEGAVASDMEICSHVGNDILRNAGGNAVDAAVATALCLGVVNPASSGIGGGAMILIHSDLNTHEAKVKHDPSYVSPPFHDARDEGDVLSTQQAAGNAKATEFIDCREEAPLGATVEMFLQEGVSSEIGGLAIAVPGELRGLELAHARHGKLAWSKIVEPAMILARDGFPVSRYLEHELQESKAETAPFANLRRIITTKDPNNNGKPRLLQEGDVLKRPRFAKTLQAIMEKGADAIYKGGTAQQIARDIQAAGGIVTAQDLESYEPVLRSPLVARNVHGLNIVGIGPPSSGGAAIIGAARFLAGYENPFAYMADTLSKHRLVEASKHVFAIRMSLSDPAFNTNTTLAAVADLINGTYMEELRRLSKDDSELSMSQYGGTKWAQLNDGQGQGDEIAALDANEGDRLRRLSAAAQHDRRLRRRFGYLNDHGTTHLSVVDKDRNAVSITSTVNTYFGSKVVSPSTGIIFNNQMDDFATPGKPNHFGLHPSEANFIAPKKRPLSSMSPTMVFQPHSLDNEANSDLGNIALVLGASGGPKIISAVLQVILNYAWLGKDFYSSVASPRIHDQLLYHGAAVTTFEREPLLQGDNITVTTPQRTLSALTKRGHVLLPVDYMGTVQAVAIDMETNTLSAVSDIRKGGTPAGY